MTADIHIAEKVLIRILDLISNIFIPEHGHSSELTPPPLFCLACLARQTKPSIFFWIYSELISITAKLLSIYPDVKNKRVTKISCAEILTYTSLLLYTYCLYYL